MRTSLAVMVSILLSAPAAGSCGDLTLDGVCDLNDLALLLSQFGSPHNGGDLDGDGDTDLADLSDLLAHYGDSALVPVLVRELRVPDVIAAGAPLEMFYEVYNAGTCWNSYYPPFDIYWSQDETLSDDDVLIWNMALNLWLAAGETVAAAPDFFIPTPCDLPPGSGYVVVRMDWRGYISTSSAPAEVISGCD